MADDEIHAFQLDGKQLVFVFMAATLVAVVVFLCGVMVGRGVRERRTEAMASEAAGDPTAAAPPAASAVSPVVGGSVAGHEDLTYPERLGGSIAPPDTLQEPAGPDAPATAVTGRIPSHDAARTVVPVPSSPAQPAAAMPATHEPSATAPEPGGSTSHGVAGLAVQVASVRGQAAADRIVHRLSAKGYHAYVSPGSTHGVFRVRVGPFTDRHEAEAAASRLAKEDQFKPWITR